MRIVVPDQRNVPGMAGAIVKKGGRTTARNPAERDHRLREHDPDLVGFGEAGYFACRPRRDYSQLPARAGCLRSERSGNQHEKRHAERKEMLHK